MSNLSNALRIKSNVGIGLPLLSVSGSAAFGENACALYYENALSPARNMELTSVNYGLCRHANPSEV